MSRLLLAGLLAATVLAPRSAAAQARDTPPGWTVGAQLFAGWNPRAALLRLALERRWIYHRDDNPVLDRAHLQLGVSADVSPAFGRYGVNVQWLPVQALRLRVEYGLLVYHGYISLLGFDSLGDDWSESVRIERSQQADVQIGHNLRIIPEVRMKVKRLVYLAIPEINLFALDHDDGLVFEPWYGLLTERTDWVILVRNLLLLEILDASHDHRLLAGAYYTYRRALGTGFENQRVGLAAVYSPADAWGPFEAPTLLVLAGFHIADRFTRLTPVILGGIGGRFRLTLDR